MTEIERALEKAREHRGAAEAHGPDKDAEIPREKLLLRAIGEYERCAVQCDRALEIVRWMPYKVDLSGQKKQARGLREEARRALAQRKRELEACRRGEGPRSEAGEGDPKDTEAVLRVYDVRDITEQKPESCCHILLPGAEEAEGKHEDKEPKTSLAEMIRSRVMPESWKAEYGASIEERVGQLVVMQKPEVHRLIEKLLASFRERKKFLIEVEKRFLETKE